MYQSYDLSRYVDGDLSRSNSFTVSDEDAVNCAHMLAAGFNTLSRKMMGDFVLAVVDTKAGTVEYDGKAEKIERPDPWSISHSFTFEPSEGDADTILTLFGNGETPTFTAVGKVTVDGPSSVAHVKRDVLEAAYLELEAVKEVLFDAGVETIPADAGVTDLRAALRARDVEIAAFVQERTNRIAEQAKYESDEYMPLKWESFAKIDDALRDNDVTNNRLDEGVRELGRRLEHEFAARTAMEAQHAQANEATRAELIEHVRRAYAKWGQVDPGRTNESLKSHLRGMIEVLSKFLAVIGEADHDERHAVAKRLCGIPEGNYLYED